VRYVKRREYRHGNTGGIRKRLSRREYAVDFVCVLPQEESDEYQPHIAPVIHYNLIIRREYVKNLTKPEEYAAGIHLIPLVEARRQNRQRIPCVTNVCVFRRCSHACIPSVSRTSQNSGNTQEVLSQSRCRILEQNTLSGK